jgi:hypothetical protein
MFISIKACKSVKILFLEWKMPGWTQTANAEAKRLEEKKALEMANSREMDEAEQEAADKANRESGWLETVTNWLSGAYLSLKGTLGGWDRNLSGAISRSFERGLNFLTGNGFNTNQEIAVNAAMQEYEAQTRLADALKNGNYMVAGSDDYLAAKAALGHELTKEDMKDMSTENMAAYYQAKLSAGNELNAKETLLYEDALNKLGLNEDVYEKNGYTNVLTGGQYNKDAYYKNNSNVNNMVNDLWKKTSPSSQNADANNVPDAMGGGIALANNYMEEFNNLFLNDAQKKAGQQSALTDVVIKTIQDGMENGDFENMTPEEIKQRVLESKVPELLKNYGMDINKKIMDYANEYSNDITYFNLKYINNLIDSFYDKPEALDDYYQNSVKYLFNIKNDFFRLDDYSPIKSYQYDALKELQRIRRQSKGLD